jgi:hypothetical protein
MFVKISEKFYSIQYPFNEELMAKILTVFDRDRSAWLQQPDGLAPDFPRLQFRPEESEETQTLYDELTKEIHTALLPAIEYAERLTGKKLYQNNPQFWYDPAGYINTIHDGDVSPNHFVNIQIYLGKGKENMGTYCYDQSQMGFDTWLTVPYRQNCGYMMLYPTQTPHGMKNPVVGERFSLYQGFRATEIPSDIW